jgi:hypothetical protein
MSDRVRLNRRVPATALSEFVEGFAADHPRSTGELASNAILEFLPTEYVPAPYRTAHHELESLLHDDLEAVLGSSLNEIDLHGDSVESESDDEYPDPTAEDRERCQVYVDRPLKEALVAFVRDEEGKAQGIVGEYVARAFNDFRRFGEGVSARSLYEQLRDTAEFVPEDRETRVDVICSRLEDHVEKYDKDTLHQRVIDDEIEAVADISSTDAIQEYRNRVLDRLNFVPVANANGVFAPPMIAEKKEMDIVGEDLSQSQYDGMDRSDRVKHLRKWLRKRADNSGQSAASVNYRAVQHEVFDVEDGPSHQYAYDLMKLAAGGEEFAYGEHNGEKRLRCNPNGVTTDSSPEGEVGHSGLSEQTATQIAEKLSEHDSPLEMAQNDDTVEKHAARVKHDYYSDKKEFWKIPENYTPELTGAECDRVRDHLNEIVGNTDSATDADSDGRAVADGGKVVSDE